MSFIGNVPAESYTTVVKDTFSGNDSTTDFTLSIPATTNSVEVFVENVQQEPTDAYTIAGTTLSFTAAPVTGTDNIYVIHRGPAVQQVVPPAGVAIDASTITGSGDMNIDSGTLFVDASADAVGIGTTTIARGPLHVHENSSSDANVHLTNNTSGATNTDGTTFFTTGVNSGIWHRENGYFRIATNNTERMRIDSTGNLQFNSGYGSVATAYGCRAWVNFDGTGTLSIRGSGNVSSVTDVATGSYHVIFTNAMPDANYAAPTALGGANGVYDLSSKSTTQCNFFTRDLSGNQQDQSTVDMAFFR